MKFFPLNLIIAGGREFNDVDLMYATLEPFRTQIDEVVSGHARGADKMGEMWAHEHNIPVKLFPAQWNIGGGKVDKMAGFKRNKDMAKYGTMLIAFWDGQSRGTGHMIRTMYEFGKPVKIIHYDDNRA